MVQIISKPSFGELFGKNLGEGLGTGLGNLAALRMQHLSQRQQQAETSRGLQALGIPSQESALLSSLPQSSLDVVLKNYLQGAENLGLNQALADLTGNKVAPQIGESQAGTLQQLLQPVQSQQLQQTAATQPETTLTPVRKSFAEILKNPRLKPEHRLKIEAMKQKAEQFERREAREISKEERLRQRDINKETEETYKETLKKYKSAVDNDKRLNRMIELNEKGNLGKPIFNTLVKSISEGIVGPHGPKIDLTHWQTIDAQEFNKLQNDFVKDAKDIFGSRITDQDLRVFMSTLPTLAQSKEGRARVINNLKSFNEAGKLRKAAQDQIIKENGGKRPMHLDSLIEERVAPQLDLLAKQFAVSPIGPQEDVGVLGRLGQALGIKY